MLSSAAFCAICEAIVTFSTVSFDSSSINLNVQPAVRISEDTKSVIPKKMLNTLCDFVFGKGRQGVFIRDSFPKGYSVTKVLGKGSFGIVLEAERLQSVDKTEKVAIKFFKSAFKQAARVAVSDHKKLYELAPALALPLLEEGVIRTSGVLRPSIYFITESFGANVLKTFSHKAVGFDFSATLEVFSKTLDLYKILREKGLTLRDCKPDNMLLRGVNEFRFIDVMLGKLEEDGSSYQCTRMYRSPYEYLGKYHESEMPFALGANLYFLITGEELFFTPFDSKEPKNRTMLKHLTKVSSFIGPLSQSLLKSLKEKYHNKFITIDDDGLYSLHRGNFSLLNPEQGAAKVHKKIIASLTSERFSSLPGDSKVLADEIYCMIKGLTNIENPWTPEQALSSSLIQRVTIRESEDCA